MTDKKRTLLRLVTFLVISFLPFIIIVPLLNAHYGGPIYETEEAMPAVYALGVFGMMIPSVAHLVTRLITKEGFRNTYLAANVRGNLKWYVASIAVKLAESALCAVLICFVYADGRSFSEIFSVEDPALVTGLLLLQLAGSVIVFFPAFGEEWGWRGYMMPKLTELMGRPAAIVVGGVIWGLWHAPLTVSGHNFSTDTNPLLAILMMCGLCVLVNTFLTLLTERTKSIYPASFCHMVNNNMSATVLMTLFCTEEFLQSLPRVSPLLMFPFIGITVVVSFILLMKKDKYEDGDYLNFSDTVSVTHHYIASMAMLENDYELALSSLEKAAEFAIMSDTLPDKEKHTSLLVNQIEYVAVISSLAENQEPTNDINEANNIKDTVLMQIAVINSEIQKRLKELCDT